MEPRLTPEKIEIIGWVDKGEVVASYFALDETITRTEAELGYLKELQPTAALIGSYPTILVTCRILHVPLVWTIQSTWLESFFLSGAGITGAIHFKPFKWMADKFVLLFINFWIRNGFLNVLNKAAWNLDIPGFTSIFNYWRGDITLVAEPAEFFGTKLPPNHYFTVPLIARQLLFASLNSNRNRLLKEYNWLMEYYLNCED